MKNEFGGRRGGGQKTRVFIGAPEENRTPTPVKETDFESAASTSSATGATKQIHMPLPVRGQSEKTKNLM
jgi:hypothetical protein